MLDVWRMERHERGPLVSATRGQLKVNWSCEPALRILSIIWFSSPRLAIFSKGVHVMSYSNLYAATNSGHFAPHSWKKGVISIMSRRVKPVFAAMNGHLRRAWFFSFPSYARLRINSVTCASMLKAHGVRVTDTLVDIHIAIQLSVASGTLHKYAKNETETGIVHVPRGRSCSCTPWRWGRASCTRSRSCRGSSWSCTRCGWGGRFSGRLPGPSAPAPAGSEPAQRSLTACYPRWPWWTDRPVGGER